MRRTLVVALLAACGAPAAAPDATPALDAPSGCVLAGTYHLIGLACFDGTSFVDVTAAYQADAPDTTLAAIGTGSPGDGCDLAVQVTGPGCTEAQTWRATPIASSGDFQLSTTGIAACTPDGCQFGASDDACAVGDHLGAGTVQPSVVLDVGTLVLTYLDYAGECARRGYPGGEQQYWSP